MTVREVCKTITHKHQEKTMARISFVTSGSGGTPGGSNTQIQYNNAGAFGGVDKLTFSGGSLFATGSFKGNLDGNAATATSAGTATSALTASYAVYADSAASATSATSATTALTASYVLNAVSASYAATSGMFGTRTHLVVEGGRYTTLQQAVDAAGVNDVILVGPTGSVTSGATWGNVSIPGGKRLTIAGLGGRTAPQAMIGPVTFSVTASNGASLNALENEVFLRDLYINKSSVGFAGTQGVLLSGDRPGRLRLQGCYIYNAGTSGDGIVNNNNAVGSSIHIDNCIIQATSANTSSCMINHVKGYTLLKNFNEVSGGKYAVSASAGTVEAYNTLFEVSGANEAVRLGGGLMTVAYSTVKNTVANGSGINMTTAGASVAMADSSFVVSTGTGYCVNGVLGTYFLYGHINWGNTALTPYNVKVKNVVTSSAVTQAFTPSA